MAFTRFDYIQPTADQQALISRFKALAEDLATLIDELPEGRDRSLAQTKLEDVVMRGTRAVFTGHQR